MPTVHRLVWRNALLQYVVTVVGMYRTKTPAPEGKTCCFRVPPATLSTPPEPRALRAQIRVSSDYSSRKKETRCLEVALPWAVQAAIQDAKI